MSGTVPSNFLSPINFKFQIKRAPNVNFFIQQVNIPGLSLQPIEVNNPLIRIPYAGDHVMYEELTIIFKIDENLQNYLEIFNWIKSEGKQTQAEYNSLASMPIYSGQGLRSEISLNILTSKRNPNYEIVFHDAFPINLTSLNFNSSLEDINYLEASAQFRYTSYDINKTT